MAVETTDPVPEGAESQGILARDDGAAIAYRCRPGRADLPGVLFLPGFRSDMGGTKAVALESFCADREQGFTAFDYQGHGRSSGRFEAGLIGTWLGDALAVLDRLTRGPQILVGSSMGGWLAVLAALQRRERVAGLVLIAPAIDFTDALIWQRLGEAERARLVADGVIRLPSSYEPEGVVVTRALIDEGSRHLLLDAAIPLACPVRILHGMGDPDVPWRHSVALVEALTATDVLLTLVKDGEHRLSRHEDLARLQRAVAELSERAGGAGA